MKLNEQLHRSATHKPGKDTACPVCNTHCRQMIQYSNGERRVIDLETMTASAFLAHDDCDRPLGAYELDHDLDDRDLDPDFQVIRSEES